MRLTVVSLFAGVGGFDLAFERAGATVVAAVEIDKAATSVLARRFPSTALFDDVTKVTGDDLRAVGFIPERGVITAGFPCQDISIAGRRTGLAGSRSGLFWEIVRLLDECHPTWVVLENVPNLLSINGGADMGAVVGALGELGYGFAYRVLDAQFFGVPQRRRRVFIVGHLGAPFGAAAEVLFESESGVGDSPEGCETRPGTAELAPVREDGLMMTLPMTPAELLIYHALVIASARSMPDLPDDPFNPAAWLTAPGNPEPDRGKGVHATADPHLRPRAATITSGRSASPGVNPPGRRQEDDINLVSTDAVVRRLTPTECERLQGFPDDWTFGSDAQRYRQMGNSLAVPVVEWIARRLIAVDGTLT